MQAPAGLTGQHSSAKLPACWMALPEFAASISSEKTVICSQRCSGYCWGAVQVQGGSTYMIGRVAFWLLAALLPIYMQGLLLVCDPLLRVADH